MAGRLFAIAILLAACDPAALDRGWYVADDGTELRPGVLPATVTASPDAEHYARAAVAWWADTLGVEALTYVDGPADVTVELGYVPPGADPDDLGGEAIEVVRLRWAEDGTILSTEITLSADLDYSGGEDTLRLGAIHGLGHGPLGLADDPGPPTTVDLRSIMSDPLDPLGVLTEGDRARLAPYVEPITGDTPEEMRR